jgi:hypothetical protein
LKRVLAISRLDGWSVVIIAGLGTLVTLAMGDWYGIAIGLIIVAAGAMEIRGNRLLKKRQIDGMKWLVRSQLFLLSVVLVYCVSRLASFDDATVFENLTPDMESALKELGISKADILPLVRITFLAGYGGAAVVTVLYQGGMALWYRGKIKLVTEALTTVIVVPPSRGIL